MHIDEADSGMACLELVQKKKYDIIFLDHMMPEMDGIETLHRMQKLEDNMCKNSYIVSLTANAIAGAEQQYLAEGFDAYLSKPIIPEKLEELILEVLPGEYIEKCKIIPNRLIDEEEEDIELPFVEGFFWDYALHNSYSSKKDLLEAVKQFHQSIPEKLEQLTKSMDDIHTKEGLERYETLIHTIKNQAADIGAMRLAGMTRSLEEAMQAGAVVEAIKTFNQTICVELEGQDERLTNVLKES